MNKQKQIFLGVLLFSCMQQTYTETENSIWHKIQKNIPKKETVIKTLCITGGVTAAFFTYYYGYFGYLSTMAKNLVAKNVEDKKQDSETTPQEKEKTNNDNKKSDKAKPLYSSGCENLSWSDWIKRVFGQEQKANVTIEPVFQTEADGKMQLPELGRVNVYHSASFSDQDLALFSFANLQETLKTRAGYTIECYTGDTIRGEKYWISADSRLYQPVLSDQMLWMAILRNKTGQIDARFIVLVDGYYKFAKIILSSINFTADRAKDNKILLDFVMFTLKDKYNIETVENDTIRTETEDSWKSLGYTKQCMKL
jgi:hypothetical protein